VSILKLTVCEPFTKLSAGSEQFTIILYTPSFIISKEKLTTYQKELARFNMSCRLTHKRYNIIDSQVVETIYNHYDITEDMDSSPDGIYKLRRGDDIIISSYRVGDSLFTTLARFIPTFVYRGNNVSKGGMVFSTKH
jgi:hypothetical protein